jgi:hypothetical protein
MAKKSSSKVTKKVATPTTFSDFKNALLVVSILINLAVFIGWILLRATTAYDQEVFNILFVR